MKKIKKKYTIKIPNNIVIIYNDKKNIITCIGPLKQKSLKLKIKLFMPKNKKIIKISQISVIKISNDKNKKIRTIQGTTAALIKQLFVETSTIIYQKLKFIGLGYRVFSVENYNKILLFKLGYSHLIYFKIPKNLQIFCLKLTKLFIFGSNYQKINQISAIIRSYKKPEPYKGKGILYENEKIILKEGKKV
uniref:Ribosomal protein L6 n=1 Tax=Amicula sp. isolate GU52X-4 cfCalB7 TaxID=3003489 RepID=A0A9E8YZK0_9STRA|nr:ribosomal protein L6 [Amicula sp. isolate GU52X-4 cfCalB7]